TIFAKYSQVFRNVLSSLNSLATNNEYKLIDLIWNKLNGNFIDIIDEQSTLMLIVRYTFEKRICDQYENFGNPVLSHIKVMANKEYT
ncbi:hypothetical protein P5V15_008491, partial [Pogonomyrmex californicus]